jgi:uncharacterized membrane protein
MTAPKAPRAPHRSSTWRRGAHRAYLAGVWFKGVHGVVDVVAAIIVLGAPALLPAGLLWAASEAGADLGPSGATVSVVVRAVGADLLSWPPWLFGGFLLVHGLVKLASALCLLLRVARGFPWAIAALGALLVYQLVDAALTSSVTVTVFAVVDIAVIALVLREYGQLRAELVRGQHEAPGTGEGSAPGILGMGQAVRQVTAPM